VQEIYRQAFKASDKQTMAERREKLKNILMNINSEETKDEAMTTANHITSIVRLLVTSKEFRSLINDLETIFEEAFVVDEEKEQKENTNRQIEQEATTFMVDPVTTTNTFGSEAPTSTLGAGNTRTYYFGKRDLSFNDTAATLAGGDIQLGNAKQSKSKDEAADDVEDTLVDHWAKIAHTLNENPEYRESINFLFSQIGSLSSFLSNKAEQMEKIQDKEEDKPQNKEADRHAREAWANAKKFIENWIANDYSLDDFLDSVNAMATKAKEDDELKEYFDNLREFFEKSAADKEYVQNEEKVKADARERIQRGRKLFRGKYRKEFERLQKELEYLNDGLQNDEGLNQLQEDFSNLLHDLFADEKGNATLHPELLRDLQIIVPRLVQQLRRLPLPDIDLSDEESDLRIRNAVLDCGDIAPSAFRFTVRGDTEDNLVNNYVQVVVSKIRARVLGADFYYNKKTFPKIQESGRADMAIYGKNGMTVAFEMCPYDGKGELQMKLRKNLCRISKLDLRLQKTDHDVLYAMMSPIINAVVKKRIELVIQDYIKKTIEDGSLVASQKIQEGAEQLKAKAN